jgi:acyl carrier protein
MKRAEFLLLVDEIMEAEPGTVTGSEKLDELEMWDSMVALEYIALVDTQFGLVVEAEKLGECQTVDDLLTLLGDNIED